MQAEQVLDSTTKQMEKLFEQKESEENWSRFEASIIKFQQVTKDCAALTCYVPLVKQRLKTCLIQSLITERTRLARSALLLVTTMANSLGERFEGLADLLLPTVLKLTTRANRVYVSSAKATLAACIEASGVPTMIPILVESLKNPSKTMRVASIECIVQIAHRNTIDRLMHWINLIEKSIAEGVLDPTPEVRDLAKELFEFYKNSYPDELHRYLLMIKTRFQETLPDMAKKYLKIESGNGNRRLSKGMATSSSSVSSYKQLAPRGSVKKSDSSSRPDIRPQPLEPTKNSVPNLNASSQSLNTAASRKMEKPTRQEVVAAAETPRPQGAQRVIRQVTNTKPRLKPAQRVVASSTQSLETPGAANLLGSSISLASLSLENSSSSQNLSALAKKASISSSQASGLQGTNASRSRLAALKATGSATAIKAPQLDKASSLTRLQQDVTDSDWAIRQDVFDLLKRYFSENESRDFASAHSEKCFKMMLTGLGDAHFKVVAASLGSILIFLGSENFPIAMLDQLLPRIVVITYNPLQKTKHAVLEKSKEIVNRILFTVPEPILGQSIVNCLGNSSSSPKMRAGLIGFVHSLSKSIFVSLFSKASTCRLLATRLVPFVFEQDTATLGMAKDVILHLWQNFPDVVSSGLANINLTERDALFQLTGKTFMTFSAPSTPKTELQDSWATESISTDGSPSKRKSTSSLKHIGKSPAIGSPILSARKLGKATLSLSITELNSSSESISLALKKKAPITEVQKAIAIPVSKLKRASLKSSEITVIDHALAAPLISDYKTFLLPDAQPSFTPKVSTLPKSVSKLTSFTSLDQSPSPEKLRAPSAYITQMKELRSPARLRSTASLVNGETPKLTAHTPKEFAWIGDTPSQIQLIPNVPLIEKTSTPLSIARISPLISRPISPFVLALSEPLSEPDSEATVLEPTIVDFVMKGIPLGPSPLPSYTGTGSSSPTNTLSRSASITQDIEETSYIPNEDNLPLYTAINELTEDDGSALKIKLVKVHEILKAMDAVVDAPLVTSFLEALFKLEDKPAEKMIEIAYSFDVTIQEIEKKVDPLVLLHRIVGVLDSDRGLKTGLEMAERALSKLGGDQSIASYEPLLIQRLMKGLSSTQSSIRKAANELSVTLTRKNDAAWVEQFYTTIRDGIGASKEMLLRSMVERRLAI